MLELVQLRQHTLEIFQAGVAAADPETAVNRCLRTEGQQLSVLLDDGTWFTGHWQKIYLLAFGKAACAMAKAALAKVPKPLLASRPIIVTNYENVTSLPEADVYGAGHPLPDLAGLCAAQRIIETANQAKQGELMLVLVSGGGSALIPCPVSPITLAEKIDTTELLLSSGASINEINCVRKHLSQLKGGGLAKLAYPADVHALILSDVLGDDLSAIASGPTVADDTTFSDAISVLKNKSVWEKIPSAVRDFLQQGLLGIMPETPKATDSVFLNTSYRLVGSNAMSLEAMVQAAQRLGYQTLLYSQHLAGEARIAAQEWVNYAKTIRQPLALLAGGETTVTLQGNGLGGRNQEMALAFAIAARENGLLGQWAFLSGGTDGRDGPTDAAGGLVDAGSINRMIPQCDPDARLLNNDSYPALKLSGDLLAIGATGTNVADLQILLIIPPDADG
jgi:glycerate 2-kinase